MVRRKFMFMLPLIGMNALILYSLHSSAEAGSVSDTQIGELTLIGTIFGVVCVLFPEILGGMQGFGGRGGVMEPTPPSIVAWFGWLLLGLPVLVWAFS